MYGVYVYTTKCVLLSDFSQLNEIELKKKKKKLMKIQNLISFRTLVETCKYMNNTNSSVELMSECAHCSQPKSSKLHKYLYVFIIGAYQFRFWNIASKWWNLFKSMALCRFHWKPWKRCVELLIYCYCTVPMPTYIQWKNISYVCSNNVQQ